MCVPRVPLSLSHLTMPQEENARQASIAQLAPVECTPAL